MAAAPGTDEVVASVLSGDRRALARALSLVENGSGDALRRAVEGLHSHAGSARVVGVTGSPGVGKSTLVSALVRELRGRGDTVAVLAVDPSSPFSGGAVLGDRVRMQDHVSDHGVFIRSMASRGHLGGLSSATPHATLVLDAAGYDTIVVETVGVGQSEVEVADAADTTIVALAPGMGDGVQAAKAGILEVADILVVNKADRDGVRNLESELRVMLHLGAGPGDGTPAWRVPVVRTIATGGAGMPELADQVVGHWAHLAATGQLAARRERRAAQLVREIALERVRARLEQPAGSDRMDGGPLQALASRVVRRDLDPYAAADELLALATA